MCGPIALSTNWCPGHRLGWAQHYVVFEAVPGMANRWVANLLDRLFNHTFFDLIETGRLGFPFGLLNGRDDDVKGCCDFVGLNVYSRFHVAFNLRSAENIFCQRVRARSRSTGRRRS